MFRASRSSAVFLILVGLLGLPLPLCAQDDWVAPIRSIVQAPRYRDANWGILVVDAETGEPVYQHHANQTFIPASTIKLFYGAAALADLGPNYKFATPVYRQGAVSHGRLQGNLILVAQGDLTLGGRNDATGHMAYQGDDHTYANAPTSVSEVTETDPLAGLKSLARQVAASGIRQVGGDVLIDDRLFARTRGNGSGPDVLSPIVVNDNVVDIMIAPAPRAGEPARIRLRPDTSYLHLDAQVVTVPSGERTEVIVRPLGQRQFQVRGQIAKNSQPVLRIFAVPDPALFARALFIETLESAGVRMAADPLEPPQADLPDSADYARLQQVALFTSPPFEELIKVTLKTSSNLYANTLPLLMAAHHGKRTLAEGLEIQRHFLKELGVPVDTIAIATASGGSRNDAVTPRAVVRLIQGLSKRPDYDVFLRSLPILGVDGTLADMVESDSHARGKVYAKTGTYYLPRGENHHPLLRCKALAGVMTTASKRQLIFAMFVNDVPLPPGTTSSREGRVLAHLCEILYDGGL